MRDPHPFFGRVAFKWNFNIQSLPSRSVCRAEKVPIRAGASACIGSDGGGSFG
jgi:hypothetical protein